MYIKYKHILFPEVPKLDASSKRELLRRILKEKAIMIVYLTDVDVCIETDYWYIVKRKQKTLEEYKKGSRRSIKRGLELYNIRQITKSDLLCYGYAIYLAACSEYANTVMYSENKYLDDINNLNDNTYTYWGIFTKENEELVGYCYNKTIEGICTYLVEKIIPAHKEKNASYAINYIMDKFYFDSGIQMICAGARNLSHETNVQEFLIDKMGYERMYCIMKVIALPGLQLVIRMLEKIGVTKLHSLTKYFEISNGHNCSEITDGNTF